MRPPTFFSFLLLITSISIHDIKTLMPRCTPLLTSNEILFKMSLILHLLIKSDWQAYSNVFYFNAPSAFGSPGGVTSRSMLNCNCLRWSFFFVAKLTLNITCQKSVKNRLVSRVAFCSRRLLSTEHQKHIFIHFSRNYV